VREAPGNLAERRRHLSRRAKWELGLAAAGLLYIALTLALSLNSPVLSVLFIGMASYFLVTGRQR
jgi:hypothetical protein